MAKASQPSNPQRFTGAKKAGHPGGAKTAQIRARIDPAVKAKAEDILEELGLTPSSAISSFYKQIVMRRGLPFALEVPNAQTIVAIQEARRGDQLIEGADLEDLLSKLLSKREKR